jgi:hypothetical protein
MDIFVHMINMPDGFKGHVNPNPDGSYSVFINAKLDYETQCKVYSHEISHIENDDFNKIDVDRIEYSAHKEG